MTLKREGLRPNNNPASVISLHRSTFQVECHTCQFGFFVERHVPHLQMIMLRASGLPVFKRCQEMGTEPDFCRNTRCLHRLTWKVLPQPSPQIVYVCVLFFSSPLTHNLSWIFSTHHSLYDNSYSTPGLDFAFPSIKFNVSRRLALHSGQTLDGLHQARGGVASALCLLRETEAWTPPSRVARK